MAILGAFILSCSDEFPQEPERLATIQPSAALELPSEIAKRDTVKVGLEIMTDQGDSIIGLEVQWQSSDSTILEVKELAPTVRNRVDSLTAQLSAVLVAHRLGWAEISVTVEHEGFERRTFADSILVSERWIFITAGFGHACGITVDNDAFCWGKTALGSASPGGALVPTKVLVPFEMKWQSLSAGSLHTCAVAQSGLGFCWGGNRLGQLGTDNLGVNEPIPAVLASEAGFRSISSGGSFSCGIIVTPEGTTCWGFASLGQTGNGQPFGAPCGVSEAGEECVLAPQLLLTVEKAEGPLKGITFSSVSVGAFHACGIRPVAAGVAAAYCWGLNDVGQAGPGADQGPCTAADVNGFAESFPCNEQATIVSFDLSFWSVSASLDVRGHTCGVTMQGEIYCWGANHWGQLGESRSSGEMCWGRDLVDDGLQVPCRRAPQRVASKFTFIAVTAGANHTCGLTVLGEAYCWGSNRHSQLGALTTELCDNIDPEVPQDAFPCSTQPVAVSGGLNYSVLAAGGDHTCGITEQVGQLYCWGRGDTGALGNGSITDSPMPVRVTEPG
jgi:alpha-tubulin suppressor-like RCC1 family protein